MGSVFQASVLRMAIRAARVLYPSGVVAVSETLRNPEGILLMPSETLSDVLHTLPCVRVLRRAYPHARIAVTTRPAAADFLEDNPDLDEVILCYPLDPPSRWRAFREVVAALRSKDFDTMFCLDRDHDPLKSLVGYLSGARVRVGYRNGGISGLYNVVVAPPEDAPYMVKRNLSLLQSVGINAAGVDTDWSPSERERRIAEQLADLRGLRRGRPLVAFETRGDGRQARPDLGDLSRILGERFDAGFVVLRESPPAAYSQEGTLVSHEGRVDLACRTIRDVLALLSCCDLFVCQATNLLHFAVAMGVPTVAVLPDHLPQALIPPESTRLRLYRGRPPGDEDLREAALQLSPDRFSEGGADGQPS